MVDLYAYVEDPPSEAVARRLVAHVNQTSTVRFTFKDGFPSIEHGFGNIRKKVPALIKMAKKGQSSLVITDLDTTPCPPDLLREWAGLPKPRPLALPKRLIFRVAIREIESWIMADRDAFARFMGIPKANFAPLPEQLSDPKQHLLNVLRSKGRKKWHKEMLPKGPLAAIGPRYNEKLCEFVVDEWEPGRAKNVAPSLERAIRAFSTFR